MIKKISVTVLALLLLLGGCSKENLPAPPAHFIVPPEVPVYTGSFNVTTASNSVAVDLNHNVYLCEETSVVKYDRYGNKLLQFGYSGIYYPADLDGDGKADEPNDGGFWGLNDISIDCAGNIYTLEGHSVTWDGFHKGNHRLQAFDKNGFHQWSFVFPEGWFNSNWNKGNPFMHVESDCAGNVTTARLQVKCWDCESYTDLLNPAAGSRWRTGLAEFGAGWCYDFYTDSMWTIFNFHESDPAQKASIREYSLEPNAVLQNTIQLKNQPYAVQSYAGVAPLVNVTSVDPPAGTVIGFFVSILDPTTEVAFFDASGNYVYSFGKYGYETGQLQSIRSIRVDPPSLAEGFPGYIYVLDPGRGLVHKFQMN